jgi:ferrous iron transport protein A
MILDIICVRITLFVFILYDFMVHITELEQGSTARLLDFGLTDAHYRRRLLSLGVTRGVEFVVVRKAPLGCPMQIEVRGTSLTLRLEEASHLILERV